jgi:hypothetical protein
MEHNMRTLIVALALTLTVGCTTINKPKKTSFYKNGQLVKTFVGRGVFDGSEWFGTYKIWTMDGWKYYKYRCDGCTIVETPIQETR